MRLLLNRFAREEPYDEFRGSEKYDIAYHHALDDFVDILYGLEMYG